MWTRWNGRRSAERLPAPIGLSGCGGSVKCLWKLSRLPFPCPGFTDAVAALPFLSLHYIFNRHRRPSLLSLIFSFHKSLFATFARSLCSLLHFVSEACSGAHHSCRALIHFPAAPLLIYLASFSAGAGISRMQPLLHLLRSYLLVRASVSIRADCCHFRPVCPCISFLFSPSLSSTLFPLSRSIHLSPSPGESEDERHDADTSRVWSGAAASGGARTSEAVCWPVISKTGD